MNNQYPQQYPITTQGGNYPTQQAYPQEPLSGHGQPLYSDAAEMNGSQNNELVRIATPLITLITQIRHTVAHHNVTTLRAQIIEEVKSFEQKLNEARYPMRTIVAARYCLCAAIDEAVMSQDWGTQSVWIEGSLLSIFQKETWGGERFYIILEDALRDIRNNIDFIEFIYFILSLGFEGKFFGEEQRAIREEIRNRVYHHIRHARAKPERRLSLRWKNAEAPENYRQRKAMLRRVSLMAGIALISLAIFYNIRVYHAASPTIDKLNNLATVDPITTFSQVIERPIVIRDNEAGN